MKVTTLFIVLVLSLPGAYASVHSENTQTVELTHEGFTPTTTNSATVTVINMGNKPSFIHGWEDSAWMGEADAYNFDAPDYLSTHRSFETVLLE